MMNNIPTTLRYTRSHEWIEHLEDGNLRVGITQHAQELLGDMVYVELPEIGRKVAAEQACAVVESVKAASDVYAPVAGQVIAVNDLLNTSPETVNKDPYGSGWLLVLRPADAQAWTELMDGAAYAAQVAAEAH